MIKLKTGSYLLTFFLLFSSASLADEPSQNSSGKSTTTKLYGRIEQIAGGTGAEFPQLKAQTAKLDVRQTVKSIPQRGQATTTNFSGSIVSSFPQQFNGNWGGNLKIWTSQLDPICWQIDSEEANRTRQLMTPGRQGSVNFNFIQDRAGRIDLEPAQVVFMVPMRETHMQEELNSMLKGNSGAAAGLNLPGMNSQDLAGVMQQMTNNMNVPIMVNFGSINRPDVEGISGNTLTAVVLKNDIRQLSPGVLEQQIITQENQRNNKTGRSRQEYAETVIRFTSQGANSLYVQAAAVNYTANRQFERKLILYGMVHRGQTMPVPTNPLGNMGGLPGITSPGGNPQMPQLPSGQNPFQNLFPQ